MSEHLTRESDESDESDRLAQIARGVLVVREGHGANCSSIGSVIDTLFAAAVVGGAVLAAVAAALAKEDVRVVGSREPGATRDVSDAKNDEAQAKTPTDEEPRA